MNNPAANHPTTYAPEPNLQTAQDDLIAGLTWNDASANASSDVECRLSERCHQWLEEARSSTSNPGIQRLIDDLHDDLYALGPIDEDLQVVVHGALQSVAAALDTDSILLTTLTMSSLN